MVVEIWSDVVCPWCYIGKRRFEKALAQFEHANAVDVVWRSFELDPIAPARLDIPTSEMLARKYGLTIERAQEMIDHMTEVAATEGLAFDLGGAQSGNSFDAHRLIHLAGARGLQDVAKERLLRAYFVEGLSISDRDTLAKLGTEIGLDADDVGEMISGDAYAAEVRRDLERGRALGITGVPFFVLDGRYGVSGAQPPEALVEALDQAWSTRKPATALTPLGSDGEHCGDDGCEV
ncbi:protein disulfide isomerase FrnE [soil metagenome]